MRISDWSSDVCSSDLGLAEPAAQQPVIGLARQEGLEGIQRRRQRRGPLPVAVIVQPPEHQIARGLHAFHQQHLPLDQRREGLVDADIAVIELRLPAGIVYRKSVGSEQRGSVSVNLSSRRIFKKKNNKM